jgi:hypothetical protein
LALREFDMEEAPGLKDPPKARQPKWMNKAPAKDTEEEPLSKREKRAAEKRAEYFEAEMMALVKRVAPSAAASLLRQKQYLSTK